MSVPAIATPRLVLVSIDAADVERILAGDEVGTGERLGCVLPGDLGRSAEGLLRIRLHELRTVPEAQPWMLRIIALRGTPKRMVGFVGFHGPPDSAGRVEVGYEVLPEHRRRGYALEATRGILEWARGQGATRFVASISPDNAASQALITRLGFRSGGSQWNAIDGTELLFELPADALPPWQLPPRAAV